MPKAFIDGIDCITRVIKNPIVNTINSTAIIIKVALKSFSFLIWPYNDLSFELFTIVVFKTSSATKNFSRRTSTLIYSLYFFYIIQSEAKNDKILFNYKIDLPSNVADLRIVSATFNAAGDNGA